MLAKFGVFLSKFGGMKGFETMPGKQRNNQKPYKYNRVFHIGGRLARSLSPKLQLWLMHQLKTAGGDFIRAAMVVILLKLKHSLAHRCVCISRFIASCYAGFLCHTVSQQKCL